MECGCMVDPLTGKVIVCEECEECEDEVIAYIYGKDEESYDSLALYYV